MVRINIDILGISELKWMGMAKFNSEDHYIYYCGQESHRRNGVALIINKRVWKVLGATSKMTEWFVCFQGKPFNITIIQVYAPTTNAVEADQFYEDLEDLLELTPKSDVQFIIGDWNAKIGSQWKNWWYCKFIQWIEIDIQFSCSIMSKIQVKIFLE